MRRFRPHESDELYVADYNFRAASMFT